ncbi:hypothetical protein BGZ60DRAFT_187238 [Tricladium varicosporioides]|nr:hypothetical protein BGZ60DRAFT_187238 [Hymenoscyphus varicosporioides]
MLHNRKAVEAEETAVCTFTSSPSTPPFSSDPSPLQGSPSDESASPSPFPTQPHPADLLHNNISTPASTPINNSPLFHEKALQSSRIETSIKMTDRLSQLSANPHTVISRAENPSSTKMIHSYPPFPNNTSSVQSKDDHTANMESIKLKFKESPTTATTLTMRTTENVIADLQRTTYPSPSRGSGPESMVHVASFPSVEASVKDNDDADDADHGHVETEGDDDDDQAQLAGRPKKITERKRRLNAVAENHVQKLLQNQNKQSRVSPEEEQHQSARWLVNQSENRKIISTPREYQVELFERAKEKNIVAVLDTGSGKTLIAVLLLRHIFAEELECRALGEPKRLSFFLVDSVTLVFQQHAVLKANLDQPMDLFCGDMGCGLWNRESWEKHFNKNMVIVCTAEVLRQCLHHSFLSMEQINLLIFDEAHHAKKDHAYARIIKDFYTKVPKTRRPKIFGMTASPVDAKTDIRKAAAELEAILHCEIATAANPDAFQTQFTTRQEILATYSTLRPQFETALYQQMRSRFKQNKVLTKPLVFAKDASRELGTWCADAIWPFCLGEEESKKLLAKTDRRYYAHASKALPSIDVLEKQKTLLLEAQEIINNHQFEPPDFNPRTWKSRNLSSKVCTLIQYLRGCFERKTNDKAIVFVKQRYTARILAKLFSYDHIRTPHLFVDTLVGTQTGDAGDLNTSFRTQVVTMMQFRKGEINCLFATSVAEEGLDIPDCNLIIRFDLYNTLIQYIQSKGRARHRNSRYVHMVEENNQEHMSSLKEVRLKERILKEFCSTLPDDRKLYGNDIDIETILAKERRNRVYVNPKTGATLNYKVSLLVLANFVDSLPHSDENTQQAEYITTVQNKQFICEVILPEASPVRGAIGRQSTTKAVAKCSAAFEACLLLIKGKYLDDNIIPIYTKQLPAMRNALLAVSKKKEAYNMKTKPAAWSILGLPEELYVTILTLEDHAVLDRPSQPLALLTRSNLPKLPSFMLHFGSGKHSPIKIQTLPSPIKVNENMIKEFTTFTLCIFDDVFSKEYEADASKMPYFLAPISSNTDVERGDINALISWDTLKNIQENQTAWLAKGWETIKPWQTEPDDFFNDKYIVDPFDGSRKLWCHGVTNLYKPLDPVPPNSAPRKGTRKRHINIMEYSCSLWGKARARRTLDVTQRVFKAKLVSLRRNLLDEFDDPAGETSTDCYITLETMKVSPLPTTIVAMSYLFPAIIHRVESYLIALEACDLLHLKIRPDLALEAITKDSDNSGDHDTEKINFQHGMGNNYERLEFLGDCFLKMATSISIYSLHPDNNEERFHINRMLLICNKNLCNNAIRLKLYEYIRSQAFNRRAWYPEGLKLKKGKTATASNSQRLGDKSIADVCEALIGAALETCIESKDMNNAVRAVTELVSSENHNVTTYGEYYKLYKKPQYQVAQATAMQRDLARQVEKKHPYHFKWPRLLRSAFIHPSYPYSYEHVPNYQRLEFLGDSLLDMACVNFLFHNYPTKDPQWLTEHKMAMASNAFLGCLCVALGFHSHLLILNATHQKQLTDYVTEIKECKTQAIEDAVQNGKNPDQYLPNYWINARSPPKCLPDIVEAYIGAIFVDSEYQYAVVEDFFDKHIKWYFEDMSIYDTYANKHPTTFLTNFLQVNMGCMDWTTTTKEIQNVDGSKPTVIAMVVIHDKVVSDASAESSRYAKVAAAKKAMLLLDGLPLPEFRREYNCTCRPGDEDKAIDNSDLHGTPI